MNDQAMMSTVSLQPLRLFSARFAAILGIAAFFCSPLFSTTDLQILTFPIGLIAGEHRIEVDLGMTQQPADLYLDGKKVCTATSSEPWCTVDFGPTPHVHLLELIRVGPNGSVTQSDQRWVNRPGQEAELAIILSKPSTNGACSGQVVWLHPEKLDPTWIEVTEDGRAVKDLDDRGSFRVPCRSPDSNQLIAASAIFPDGRRAEAITIGSVFGEESRVTMTAVALSLGNTKKKRIVSAPSVLGKGVTYAERAGA